MSKILGWWPAPVAFGWLYGVQAIAGAPAAFFSGCTGLMVCMLAFWEAGARRPTPCSPTADDRG